MIKLNNKLVGNMTGANNSFSIEGQIDINKQSMLDLVYNGSAEAKKILDQDLIVDGSKIVNKQKTFTVLSYAAGSQVGVTTKGANLASSLYRNGAQFFNKETGRLSLRKIRKVLKYFGINENAAGSDYKYESVFVEGVNKDIVVDRFNRATVICRVSSHEIREFADRIRRLDVFICTVEDLKMIARDLDAICRALQELSIDVAKDASKNIGIDIHKLVNCKSNAHSDVIKKGEVVNNIKDGIDRMLETNTMGDFKYEMKTIGFQFLKDVDPNDNGALAEAVIEDVIGKCQEAINAGMTESIDNVVELLKTSNGDKYSLYAPYIQMAKNPIDDAALKVNHLVKMAISAYNTIGALYSAKFNGYSVSSAYIRDVAKQMRNALYTEANKYGVDQTDMVKFAIAASFCYIDSNGNVNSSKKAKLYAVKLIFPQEFVLEYIADGQINPREAVTTALTLTKTTRDLFVDEKLNFVDGVCLTEEGMVMVQEDYTGEAVVTEDGELIAMNDFYAYEEVGYVALDSTCVDNIADLNQSTLVMPEKIDVKDEDIERYNDSMTEIVKDSLGYVITGGHMAVKNKDNTVTVIGTAITSHKTGGRIPVGAITKNGGFICYIK